MKNIINKRKYCKELVDRLNTAGKLIYQRRNLLNYSRQELSNKLMLLGVDISIQSLYDIEIGKRTVLDYELCSIAKVLDISTDELLSSFKAYLDSI